MIQLPTFAKPLFAVIPLRVFSRRSHLSGDCRHFVLPRRVFQSQPLLLPQLSWDGTEVWISRSIWQLEPFCPVPLCWQPSEHTHPKQEGWFTPWKCRFHCTGNKAGEVTHSCVAIYTSLNVRKRNTTIDLKVSWAAKDQGLKNNHGNFGLSISVLLCIYLAFGLGPTQLLML